MFKKFSIITFSVLLGTMSGGKPLQAMNGMYDTFQRAIWGDMYDDGTEPEDHIYLTKTQEEELDESLKIDQSTEKIKLAGNGAEDGEHIDLGHDAAQHSIIIKNMLENPALTLDQPIKLHDISHQTLPSIRDCLVIIHNRLEKAQKYNDNTDKCAICLEQLDQAYETSTMSTTTCGHKYHKGCLDSWMSTLPEPICPLCRSTVAQATINNETLQGLNKNLLGYIKKYLHDIEQLDELMLAADNLAIDPLLDVCDKAFGFAATDGSVPALRKLITDESYGQRQKIVKMILIALCNKTNPEFKNLSPAEKDSYSIQGLQALFEKNVDYQTGLKLIIKQMRKNIATLKQKLQALIIAHPIPMHVKLIIGTIIGILHRISLSNDYADFLSILIVGGVAYCTVVSNQTPLIVAGYGLGLGWTTLIYLCSIE